MPQRKYVSFVYTLTDAKGKFLESVDQPLSFVEGCGQIFPALEDRLLIQQEGTKTEILLKTDEAYGDYESDLVFEIAKQQIEGLPQIGDQLSSVTETGDKVDFVIVDQKDDVFILDGNHPLAGQDLIFHVEVITNRLATPDELTVASTHQ